MPANIAAMSLPELATVALVVGIPLLLGLLALPLLRNRPTASRCMAISAEAGAITGAPLGLSGQWSFNMRQLDSSFERFRVMLQLHQAAANHLGAIDHEIEHLWRDTKAIMVTAVKSAQPT